MNGGEAINIILGRRDRYPGPLFRFDESVPYDSWLRFYYLLWPQYGNGWIWHGNGLRIFSSYLEEESSAKPEGRRDRYEVNLSPMI